MIDELSELVIVFDHGAQVLYRHRAASMHPPRCTPNERIRTALRHLWDCKLEGHSNGMPTEDVVLAAC